MPQECNAQSWLVGRNSAAYSANLLRASRRNTLRYCALRPSCLPRRRKRLRPIEKPVRPVEHRNERRAIRRTSCRASGDTSARDCCGLRGQPLGPHHSNLISAAPSMTRGVFPETKRASRVWLRRLITKGIAGILGRGGCRTNSADAGGCGPACLHARITATMSRLRATRNAIVVSVNGRRRHHEKR
jgi:hypothetical protein